MNIGIMGTGYVGLVHGATLAGYGFQVTCMDVDENKIDRLNRGLSPIYEPGLAELLESGIGSGKLAFTTSAKQVVQSSDVIFIAVGTPAKEDGGADLSYVKEAMHAIGKHLNGDKLVVCKSTMPVGTSRQIARYFDGLTLSGGDGYRVEVASNPEFLRQGKAVSDALTPSRVVIGTDSEAAQAKLQQLYQAHIVRDIPFLYTDWESAEMIKYASNSFLAVKISFINELALLAEQVGGNIADIAAGMGLDDRISPHFLQAGPGYGGSCFPKDTQALLDMGRRNGEELQVVGAAVTANEKQKAKMVDRISDIASFGTGSLKGKTIAVWGLSFKPDTDDVRYAPSLDIVPGLIGRGATVRAYCPEGMKAAERELGDAEGRIVYCESEADSARGADAIVILTEWSRFRDANWAQIAKTVRGKALIDLRNMFANDDAPKDHFQYYSVGTKGPSRLLREAQ